MDDLPARPTNEDVFAWCARALPGADPVGVERLSGGFMNHVFRVDLGGRRVILKHTPGYVASDPSIALSDGRGGFERAALEAVAEWGTEHGRVPEVLGALEAPRVLVTEDLGLLPHLGEVLADAPRARALGARLGSFIASLHRVTADVPALATRFDNASVQQVRYASQYANVSGWLRGAGVDDGGALGAHADALGRGLTEPGVCLTMGDLWPQSVLCDGEDVRVIDWEFAHYGRPCQDVAHLGAHLWLAHAGGAGEGALAAWEGFVGAYVAGAPASLWSELEVRACAIHFAAEVLTRTVGAFAGSVSAGPDATEAVARAEGALRRGADAWFDGLG